MDYMKSEFSIWLEKCFLDWQNASGERKTIKEFAEYLDNIEPSSLSYYMSGTKEPRGKNVDKIAKILGGEVYTLLGLVNPDPVLKFINSRWEKLNPETQQQIREIINAELDHDKTDKNRGMESFTSDKKTGDCGDSRY